MTKIFGVSKELSIFASKSLMMKTKSEKQGEPSQMMIIMDEMFRSEKGATYDDIISAYCDRRNYDEELREVRYNKLKQVAGKAKCFLTKRISNEGIKILCEKYLSPPKLVGKDKKGSDK